MSRIINWDEMGATSPTHFVFRGGEFGASMCIFVTDFPPGRGPRLHRHPYEEVFVVQEGTALFTAGEQTIEAGVGQVVIVPAETPHKYVNAGEARLRVTSVHPRPHVVQFDLEE